MDCYVDLLNAPNKKEYVCHFVNFSPNCRRTKNTETIISDCWSAADDNIYGDDSVKRSILSSPLFEFSTVYSATNNFSEKLGEGGFGPVFKVEYWIIHILPPTVMIWLTVQLIIFIWITIVDT
jgi:hypothetical protein